MTQETTKPYEGLFLFPQSQAGDLQGAIDQIQEILERGGAKLISLRKWDERRLAYEIRGNKRGVYFLAYFAADPAKMAAIERACNLSEALLRSMIIRADHLTAEKMEAADGRAELADEINLRKQESREEQAGEGEDAEAAVTVETEAATGEKAV